MHPQRTLQEIRATVSAPVDPYEAARVEKLHHIEALGLDPWGGRFDGHTPIEQVLALPGDLPEEQRPRVRIAGRIVTRRTAGKALFLDLWDWSGKPVMRQTKSKEESEHAQFLSWSSRIQVMLGAKQVGEQGWKLAQELDFGDLIGVEGSYGRTRTGEPTVFATGLT